MKIYHVEVNGVKVDVKESLHVIGIDAFRRLIANLLNVPPASVYISYRDEAVSDKQTKLDL